jgi:hypothetical protein
VAEAGTIYVPSSVDSALRQGEILSGLVQAYIVVESIGPDLQPEVEYYEHPWTIIVSQDCDLDWDYQSRQSGATISKMIPNVLFCEVTEAAALRQGRGERITSDMWARIRQNNDERYHFLQGVTKQEDRLAQGLPELAIDFKRYFTIPTDEVYHRLQLGTERRCCLRSPYLEHLCTRFRNYQSRVALPEEHFSQPS